MNFLTSLGICILATLILAFLQVKTGIFAMLYHFASGKKGKRYADALTFYYVVGILGITAPLASAFLSVPDTGLVRTILSGVCFALAFLVLVFYYRYKKGSQLYLSRKTVAVLNAGAKRAHASDAFMLGVASGLIEFVFTIPLYMVICVEVGSFERLDLQIALITLAVLAGVVPVFLYHAFFFRGLNLADIGKIREKNKNFYRYLMFVCYILIGFALINFGGLI
jgi:hypothetical protein